MASGALLKKGSKRDSMERPSAWERTGPAEGGVWGARRIQIRTAACQARPMASTASTPTNRSRRRSSSIQEENGGLNDRPRQLELPFGLSRSGRRMMQVLRRIGDSSRLGRERPEIRNDRAG